MKKLIITAMILISTNAFSVEEQSVNYKTNNDFSLHGFRELKWDEPISNYKEHLTLFEKGEGIKLYKRKNENLAIGNAKLTNLVYSFKNERFFGAMLYTQGKTNGTAIIAELDLILGKDRRKPGHRTRAISWINKHVNAGGTCNDSYNFCQFFYTKK